jgi:Transcriptional regulator, AbiEi antitoxin/Protein of unknown function (DUF559)
LPTKPLAELAAAQHGVVATRQLLAHGVSDQAIARLRAAAWLHRVQRGVYAVGHRRLTERGYWMAAVLACGDEAVLSHHQAAALHGLRRASLSVIHVTAPSRHRAAGVYCHRAAAMRGRRRLIVDGIPVTSVERTLLDLAAVLPPQRLRTVIESAQRSGRYDHDRVLATLSAANGHRGIGALQRAVAELHDEPPATRSELEELALEIIRAAGLPEPSVNPSVTGETVDLSWPQFNLVVEIDSYRYHHQRSAFETDRRRGNRLQLAHVTLLRFTDRDLNNNPERLVTEIWQAIRTASPAAGVSSPPAAAPARSPPHATARPRPGSAPR